MTRLPGLVAAGFVLLAAGCATQERFILLPQADGRPSALIIKGPGGEAILAEPYAQAITGRQTIATGKIDAGTVATRYASTLAALPPRPERILLFFESGSENLTAESVARLPAVRSAAAASPGAEVVVTGHTDRVGRLEANDALGEKRARLIRERLIAAGIAAERISIVNRGEREPLVATRDAVAEPRNRRVEVKLR